ncbi:MAG: hypothetical protein AAGH15_00740 [Myxococcota bacterium]
MTSRRALCLFVLAACGGASPATDGPDLGGPDTGGPDVGAPDAGADLGRPDAGVGQPTDAQLATFWAESGGRDAFPATYVSAVEALLRAEDEVAAGDYAAARRRLDAIFREMPLSDPVWWQGVGQDGTNVGTPVAYYGLRMLDVIADAGLADPAPPTDTLRMTVLLATCAEGQRPTTPELDAGEEVRLALDPALRADDHRIVHQSLALFRQYVRAIAGVVVEVEVQTVEICVEVVFSADPARATIRDAGSVVSATDAETRDATDFWWVLYPSNVPTDPAFGDMAFITGGMGGFGRAPLFIIDDLWLVRKPPHLGTGTYSDVERRVYLPQWLQHEFFHHLYRIFPEFGLEETGHQWFDRGTWPEDFVGAWEPDYYAESVAKRFRGAEPSLNAQLRTAATHVDLSAFTTSTFAGAYRREPVQNPWHEVTLEVVDEAAGTLRWTNAAGVSWIVRFLGTRLETAADSPYGLQTVAIVTEPGEDGPRLTGLAFLGEVYQRQP